MKELKLANPSTVPRIALVAARFNHFITEQLVEGARDALDRHGLSGEQVVLAWVPGAYELPLAADWMLSDGGCDAVVALGAVIRGGTPHFDYVAGECSRGLAEVALKHSMPVAFGVLTTDTVEQALERASTAEGNKGFDAAMTALNMLALRERIGPDGG
ncbi:MAG: 6,7-dimethyl-8-ribityllumazine synthase [Xanthomonadales bacterium]|nr:6,7-dimethyl-8-ribityllumazine synthase [Xanthomonadales bacterium]NIX13254.1 6,7-dimethyl-8-ribityllumazine synthase [Xanthomonadales bacterium]